MRKSMLTLVLLILLVVAVAACGTPTAPEARTEPLILAQIDGVGSTSTGTYDLPKCSKSVMYWTVFPDATGWANILLNLHNADKGTTKLIVNAHKEGVSAEGFSGSNLQALLGGKYYFEAAYTNEPWKLRIECQDGLAPVASGTMELQGTGIQVSANYELPACKNSAFTWTVNPDEDENTVLGVYLVKAGQEAKAVELIDEYSVDQTAPRQGEALQEITGGIYYLCVVGSNNQPWTVRWECRD